MAMCDVCGIKTASFLCDKCVSCSNQCIDCAHDLHLSTTTTTRYHNVVDLNDINRCPLCDFNKKICSQYGCLKKNKGITRSEFSIHLCACGYNYKNCICLGEYKNGIWQLAKPKCIPVK